MYTKETLLSELTSFAKKDSLNDWTREKHYDVCFDALNRAVAFVEFLPDNLPIPQDSGIESFGEVIFEYATDESDIQIEFLNYANANVQGFNYFAIAKNSKEQDEYTGSSLNELYQFLVRFLG